MNFRYYQLEAVEAVEKAVIAGQRQILLAMATGTGKTRTILGMVYRFLKTNRFRRILFLVDRTALGEQAQDVFNDVKLEDLQPLNKIYNINTLDDIDLASETRIQVATVQGMISRIMSEDKERIPSSGDFDCIIVDEAHLIAPDGDGMYRTFLQDMKGINPRVRLIGLTATPFRLKGGLICKPDNLLNEICYEAGLKEMIQQGYLSPLVSRAGRAEADLSNLHIRGVEFIGDEI